MDLEVADNPDKERFEIVADGELAGFVQYHLRGDEIALTHTQTDDRFRGRVFSADLGFSMLTIAAGAYLCGRLLDAGVAARTVATWTGLVMLIPAALWALAMQVGRKI